MNTEKIRDEVISYVDRISDDIVALTQDLVRMRSINHPPTGEENDCQDYVYKYLSKLGLKPDRYLPSDVDSIEMHPAWWPGRDYVGRPNVTSQIDGKGEGRSLLLSGHIDTVPLGTTDWSYDPFGAVVEDGKLYGLGSFDMKGGVTALLSAVRVIKELDIPLAGDLIAETVVDEEFGGVNGTLAGRLRGYIADAMIITEPSGFKIWNGNCGGRFLHLFFKTTGGIALDENVSINVVDQINAFLNHLEEFKQLRRSKLKNWKDLTHDPVPVWITKISLGGWGTSVPITVPSEAKVEMYWQLLPGETQEKVDEEFNAWFSQLLTLFPDLFSSLPEVKIPVRFMPASEVAPDHLFIREMSALLEREQGRTPEIELGRGPSDLFVVNHFFETCPSIMFGTGGGNAHEADEYVLVDDVINLTKLLVLFAIQWCGLSK